MVETTQDTAAEKSPLQILQETIKGFPTQDRIQAWKAQVPGHRIKLFSPDPNRVYFLRGLSGLELAGLQKTIVQNAENPDVEMAYAAAAKCCLWTNTTQNGALDEAFLRTSGAGLAASLFEVIQNLSDFYSPQQIFQCSLEL